VAKKPLSSAKKPAAKAIPASVKEAAKAVPRRHRRAWPWLIAAIAALAVGLLVWAKLAGLIPGQQTEDPAAALMEQRVAALDQRLTAIEAGPDDGRDDGRDAARLEALTQRIAEIEARPQEIPDKTDLGPLDARLAALEQAFEALPQETADSAMANDGLENRIAALEARPATRTAPPTSAATLLAVAQLRAVLGGSGPYEAALAALEAVAAGGDGGNDAGVAAALAVLTPNAGTGIASPRRLRDRFTPLAEAILRAVIAPPGDSWMSRTLARLSGLVSVRRIGGDVAGDTAEAIVARAEAHLEAGDLAAAVAEVAALDGPAAEAAAGWLGQARDRIAADQALATLDAIAIAALSGS
jgi:hypothetical protein